MSAVKANGALPSTPPSSGLRLRLRRWMGTVAWGAYRGDNPGILIGAMLILIAIFAYLLRDTGFMSPINLLSSGARQNKAAATRAPAKMNAVSCGIANNIAAAINTPIVNSIGARLCTDMVLKLGYGTREIISSPSVKVMGAIAVVSARGEESSK